MFVLEGRSAEGKLSDCVFETREFETRVSSYLK